MRILVIGNPVAGGGRARALAARLVTELERRHHEVEPFLTGKAGDAAERAGRVPLGADRLVVVGGDGSLHEVLNGLADPSRIPLAQLPTGTANVLGHELGLPREPEASARMIESGGIVRLDMGIANGTRFLAVVSAGFDAMVIREIQRGRSGTLGYRGYLRPILRVLGSYRTPRLGVSVDGGEPVEGGLVIASNTRNYAGLFTIADRARCDSGHLDVCVFSSGSLLGLVRAGVAALTGGVSGRRGITYLTGRSLTVTSSRPVPVEIDGESHGETPVSVELRPAQVPFLVPSGESDRAAT